MMLETNFYLLLVTGIVSLLHTLFECLAFKNDIAFWNSREGQLEGISVKSLYMNLGMSFIILLYLLENETSKMVTIPNALGIVLEFWKLKQASKLIRTESFPYFWLEDSDSYVNSKTKDLDKEAMTYMGYAIYPLIACYTVYSLFYKQHKGWY